MNIVTLLVLIALALLLITYLAGGLDEPHSWAKTKTGEYLRDENGCRICVICEFREF